MGQSHPSAIEITLKNTCTKFIAITGRTDNIITIKGSHVHRIDSRRTPSQWETSLQSYKATCWPLSVTHWGRVTHICVSVLTIIGSDNGLAPGRRQAIIWINAEILLIRTSGTNFSEILSEIHKFSFKKCIWICRLENVGHFVSASMS